MIWRRPEGLKNGCKTRASILGDYTNCGTASGLGWKPRPLRPGCAPLIESSALALVVVQQHRNAPGSSGDKDIVSVP